MGRKGETRTERVGGREGGRCEGERGRKVGGREGGRRERDVGWEGGEGKSR